jgi:hypothetical protein
MELPTGFLTPDSPKKGASPVPRPPRTWAGHGTGVPCNACGIAIGQKDIEYEVEMQPGDHRTLHFHFNCYQEWLAAGRDRE